MRKFNVPCNFGGAKSPVTVYIGHPKEDHHPLQFQADWLSKERGGTIPTEIMESLGQLRELADKNGVDFEELCAYALEAAATLGNNEAGAEQKPDSSDGESSEQES